MVERSFCSCYSPFEMSDVNRLAGESQRDHPARSMTAQPHEGGINALVRACDVHDMPWATNVATARMVLDDAALTSCC